jgi:hypothetical protein
VQLDGPTSFHGGLIVNEGVIYTATARETVALDARSCSVLWTYDYTPEEERCGGSTRGVTVHNGRVFRGTCDGRFIALDATTGELLWKNVIAEPDLGESTSAVPLAWQNLVFMGIAGSELGARGRVMAYDAVTGQELWRFHTIPMGDDVGAETWERPGTAKTGDATQEGSLPGSEWFDTATYPTARFEATAFKALGGNRYEATGTLRIKMMTVPVVLPFTFDEANGTATVEGRLELDRTALNMGMASDAGGDWVSKAIGVEIKVNSKVSKNNPAFAGTLSATGNIKCYGQHYNNNNRKHYNNKREHHSNKRDSQGRNKNINR